MNEKVIQSFYTYLQSQETAQSFLFKCYRGIEGIDAEVKSYENCNTFIYYLKHGLHFYETGRKLTTVLQPILFFYGMIHLLKASLLTKRPNYPETTKLLAHGVSSRKRKKRNYTFMDDEVTIHYHGLYPYFSEHLFSIKKMQTDKFKMIDLFALIPEMSLLFTFNNQEKMVPVGKMNVNQFTFPIGLLDKYHLTVKAFLLRISKYLPEITNTKIDKTNILVELATPLDKPSGPFFLHYLNKSIYFPSNRISFLPMSEVMVHYLLLYNLSMLSRYETEWWGELITTRSETDYPFIKHFLQHTTEKVTLLLGQELYLKHLGHN